MRVYVSVTAAIAAFWLAPGSVADPSSFVIQGDYKIGGYAVKKDGTLFGAIKEFGSQRARPQLSAARLNGQEVPAV